MTANKKSPTGGTKMPVMPEAVAWIHSEDLKEIHEGIERKDAPAFASPDDVDPEYRDGMNPLYTADQMRAMYLAGIAAARECVPASAGDYGEVFFNACRDQTLANLSALELQVNPAGNPPDSGVGK